MTIRRAVRQEHEGYRGILTRLARDRRGNTLAMMAIALIPITGLAGSAIDTARMYYVKVRLQQACDAGVLAGRKFMVGNNFDDRARDQANAFFRNNFQTGMMGSGTPGFVPVRTSGNQVAGTATVTVPMTLTRMMGMEPVSLRVTCEAKMEIPNLDIMFVLDTTGSMKETNRGDSVNKITALRTAVIQFYDTMARARRPDTQIRYGAVPYSDNVNVGMLLRPEWLADKWTYQSRAPIDTPAGKPSGFWWEYRPVEYDVSALKGSGTTVRGGSFTAPVADGHKLARIEWNAANACIEERATVRQTLFPTIPTAAYDLDIDRIPDPNDPDTQWKPALPGLVFDRTHLMDSRAWTTDAVVSSATFDSLDDGLTYCPSPAMRLSAIGRADMVRYIDDLRVNGSTNHDIGFLWGARLISPTGLFRADNTQTSSGGEISRHMIFMTDGDTQSRRDNYDAYGLSVLDRRRTTGLPTDSGQDQIIENRLKALCVATRQRGITIWVIAFGTSLTPLLRTCSSDGRAFQAANSTQLNTTFSQIATQIAKLRISK